MNPVLDRSMTPSGKLAGWVQEHAPAAVAAAQEHGEAAAAGAHAPEEWGTDVMMHHVVDSNVWEFGPFGEIHLPEFPPLHVGGLEIDLFDHEACSVPHVRDRPHHHHDVHRRPFDAATGGGREGAGRAAQRDRGLLSLPEG